MSTNTNARFQRSLAVIAAAVSLCLAITMAEGQTNTESPRKPGDAIVVTPREARTSSQGDAGNVTGRAEVEQLFGAKDESRVTGGVVSFQPGARSAWHTHPVGQVLIITAGSGLVQQWDSPVHIMKTGDVVWIPAGVKHWHGASPSSSVTHIAIQESSGGRVVDWMEPVTDAQYLAQAAAP